MMPFNGVYTKSKNSVITLLVFAPIAFVLLYYQKFAVFVFPFISFFSIDMIIAVVVIEILFIGYAAEYSKLLPFGFYKDHNNTYRFGQILGIVQTKITALVVSNILLIYLLVKYYEVILSFYEESFPEFIFFTSTIGIAFLFYSSLKIMVKLLNDLNDYIEINKSYIEWYDMQALPEAQSENYFLKNPIKKGVLIRLNVDEIVSARPIIKKEELDKEGNKKDIKNFLKFVFTLIGGASIEFSLDSISQIPNGDDIYAAIQNVLGKKMLAIEELD